MFGSSSTTRIRSAAADAGALILAVVIVSNIGAGATFVMSSSSVWEYRQMSGRQEPEGDIEVHIAAADDDADLLRAAQVHAVQESRERNRTGRLDHQLHPGPVEAHRLHDL